MHHANIAKAISDGVTWNELKGNVVKGVSDFASGLSTAAKAAPFPLNIPLIAGHAATAMPHLMAVKNALSMFKGKKSGGAPSIGSVGKASASSVSAPSFNVVGQGSVDTNILKGALEGQNNAPIKAYVVSQDVSSSQELERKAKGTASL